MRFWEFLTSQDLFGEPIGLSYHGKGIYQTRVGALLSLATWAIMLAVLATRITEFLDKSTQVEAETQVKVNLLEAEALDLEQMDYYFVLGSNIPTPPEIGRWWILKAS